MTKRAFCDGRTYYIQTLIVEKLRFKKRYTKPHLHSRLTVEYNIKTIILLYYIQLKFYKNRILYLRQKMNLQANFQIQSKKVVLLLCCPIVFAQFSTKKTSIYMIIRSEAKLINKYVNINKKKKYKNELKKLIYHFLKVVLIHKFWI